MTRSSSSQNDFPDIKKSVVILYIYDIMYDIFFWYEQGQVNAKGWHHIVHSFAISVTLRFLTDGLTGDNGVLLRFQQALPRLVIGCGLKIQMPDSPVESCFRVCAFLHLCSCRHSERAPWCDNCCGALFSWNFTNISRLFRVSADQTSSCFL